MKQYRYIKSNADYPRKLVEYADISNFAGYNLMRR